MTLTVIDQTSRLRLGPGASTEGLSVVYGDWVLVFADDAGASEAQMIAEDASWEAVQAGHEAAVDALLASLKDQIARGDTEPFDVDNL